MSIPKNISNKAINILSDNHDKIFENFNKKKLTIFNKIPEIKKIYDDIYLYNINIVKTAPSHSDICDISSKILNYELESQKKIKDLLTQNGYDSDYLEKKYYCNKCLDKGFINGKKCDCIKQIEINLLSEEFNKSTFQTNKTFNNFNLSYYPNEYIKLAKYTYNYLLDFITNFPSCSNILICGNSGLGKTHLSIATGLEIIKKGYAVLYYSSNKLINDYEEFLLNKEIRDNPIYLCEDTDLLIIDDLGTEVFNYKSNNVLYEVLNNRIDANRSTIINTNLDENEILKKYGERIHSRIFGNYQPLILKGNDIRIIQNEGK